MARLAKLSGFQLAVISLSALLWTTAGAQDPDLILYFPSGVEGPSGSEQLVTTLFDFLDPDREVQGWQYGVCDDDNLTVLDAVTGSTVLTINQGGPPDFEQIEIVPGGVTQGLIISFFGDDVLEAGKAYEFLDITYLLDGEDGSTGLIEYCQQVIGDPPVVVVITVGWQSIDPTTLPGAVFIGSPFIRGDADGDGAITIGDPIYNLNYQFLSGPSLCLDAHDTNADGMINIPDAFYSLDYQFLMGPPPPGPFPDCGVDPKPNDIDCKDHPICP